MDVYQKVHLNFPQTRPYSRARAHLTSESGVD